MHHGYCCAFDYGHFFAFRDEDHPCFPSFGPSLAGYNPAGYLGIAKELVAGLDRLSHQRQPGLVDRRTVTEKGPAGWDLVGWDPVGWDPVGWDPVG